MGTTRGTGIRSTGLRRRRLVHLLRLEKILGLNLPYLLRHLPRHLLHRICWLVLRRRFLPRRRRHLVLLLPMLVLLLHVLFPWILLSLLSLLFLLEPIFLMILS